MQRQLKFRMPIHVDGKFSHWHYWGFIDGEFVGPDVRWVNVPSQQFTGVQDKYGVDIYEGDVLKIQLPMGGFWGNVRTEKVGKVFYEPEAAGFLVIWPGGRNQNFVQLDYDIVMTSEILGNTTENPELPT